MAEQFECYKCGKKIKENWEGVCEDCGENFCEDCYTEDDEGFIYCTDCEKYHEPEEGEDAETND